MIKVFLTGGTGFVGRNILPELSSCYTILAPKRNELDLYNEHAVYDFVKHNRVDIILHFANPNPYKNSLDSQDSFFFDSLKLYYNIKRCSAITDKIFYLGSGAEYDKRFDINSVTEDQIGANIPSDLYGFAKYIMNEDARQSANIYNLRIFGCYGPTDAKTKFIRDAIDCCLENRAVTIRQNCLFDYMYVEDLAKVIHFFIEHKPVFHDYNVCSGIKISLKELADIVSEKMNNPYSVEILKQGWNKEYTADNTRLVQEFSDFSLTSFSDGIDKQIKWQRGLYEKTCV